MAAGKRRRRRGRRRARGKRLGEGEGVSAPECLDDMRDEIVEEVTKHRLVVAASEPGCRDKACKIPMFLMQSRGLSSCGMIVCTQPRKVAVMSLAKRVAEDADCQVGAEVGYHVGLQRQFNSDSKLVYMTEATLLRLLIQRGSRHLGVLVIDQTLERSAAGDLLLGVLKHQLMHSTRREMPLRMVIMSSAANLPKFQDYFDHPPVIRIPVVKAHPTYHYFLNHPTKNRVKKEDIDDSASSK